MMNSYLSPSHNWISRDKYFQIHDAKLNALTKEGFVVNVDIEQTPSPYIEKINFLNLRGTIYCVENLEFRIRKTLEVRQSSNPLEVEVRTIKYAYALLKDGSLVHRYCSPHRSHRPFHHKHLYDENESEIEIKDVTNSDGKFWGKGDWPNLGQVLDEAKLNYYYYYYD